MYARMLCLNPHEDILGAHECLNDRTDLLGKQFLNLRPPAEIFYYPTQLAQAQNLIVANVCNVRETCEGKEMVNAE